MKVFEIEYGGEKRKLMFGMFAILIYNQNKDSKLIEEFAQALGVEKDQLVLPVLIYSAIKGYNVTDKSQADVTLKDCLLWMNNIAMDDAALIWKQYAESSKQSAGLEVYQDPAEDEKKKA